MDLKLWKTFYWYDFDSSIGEHFVYKIKFIANFYFQVKEIDPENKEANEQIKKCEAKGITIKAKKEEKKKSKSDDSDSDSD